MAIVRLSTAARNAFAKAVGDLVDADAGAGTLKLYTGAVPADGDTVWLVAGPDADPTGATVIPSRVVPILRATDSPEIIVRKAPRIYVGS